MQYSQVSDINDLHHLILLEMDIDTLSKYCHTNTTVQKYCNRASFWKEKFNYDRLPLIGEPENLQIWINMYKLTLQAKTDVRHMMLVIKITNSDVIIIKGPKSELYSILGKKSNKQTKIKLTIKINNGYTITDGEVKIVLSEYDLVQFLIDIQYRKLVGDFNGNKPIYRIGDEDKVPYLINQDEMDYFSAKGGDAYYNNISVLEVRYHMLKTILYLEKDPIMLTNNWYDNL